MALEAASFINDLVTTNPVAGDNVSQGDDHIRLLKATIKATFPNLSRAIYLEQAAVDLASATTPDLSTPASDYINITGTTQIDGFATEPAGFMRLVRFAGALTLNYNGTSFILITGDDVITAAGDHAVFVSLGSGNWRMVWYSRANGRALAVATLADATEGAAGIVEMATDAEIRSGAAGAKAIMAADIESASSLAQLTDAATIAVDWDTFITAYVDIASSRVLGNPTNGQVGTFRNIMVRGTGGAAALTFGNQFIGELPVITDVSTTRWYLLTIFCFQPTQFIVSAKRAL